MKNQKYIFKRTSAIILSLALVFSNLNTMAFVSNAIESDTIVTSDDTQNEEFLPSVSVNDLGNIEQSKNKGPITDETNSEPISTTLIEEPVQEGVEIKEVDTLNDLSVEVAELNTDDNLNSTNTYATKRLIVLSSTSEFDNYNASSVVNYDSLYILTYETEGTCKYAYEQLINDDSILSVEVDAIMETEINDIVDSSVELIPTETELKYYLESLTPVTEVKVAILDTGIDTTKFDNVIDVGINLSSSGTENSILDDNGHGTEMATIIADNSNGYVKLVPIKIANSDGKATVLNTYLGIQKAIENGANIINISMNAIASSQSKILTSIIDEATEQGIYVVVSAGNNNIDTINTTPANIESATVVSAVDENNNFADYSNYGSTVDYSATGIYSNKTGTSYAAANVSAYIATLLSANEDITILDNYTIDLGTEGKDNYYGNGYLGYNYFVTNENNAPTTGDISCEDESVCDKDLSVIAQLGYVALGDTTFDITTDFRNIIYNSEYTNLKFVSCEPEFDVNKEGNYHVIYNVIDNSTPDNNYQISRIITVINDKEFVENLYSLKTSANTKVIKSGSGTVYTAYSSLEDTPSRMFKSGSNQLWSNAKMIAIIDTFIAYQKLVNNGKTTWDDIYAYGEAVYLGEAKSATLPSGTSKWGCFHVYLTEEFYNSDEGGRTLKKFDLDYLNAIRDGVKALTTAGIEAQDACEECNYSPYSKYFDHKNKYWNLVNMYLAHDTVYPDNYNRLKGTGTGYGGSYTAAPQQADYKYYTKSAATNAGVTPTKKNCYVMAVEADRTAISTATSKSSNINYVPIIKNLQLKAGEQVNFTFYGKGCNHVGVVGNIWMSVSSSPVTYASENQKTNITTFTLAQGSTKKTSFIATYYAPQDGYYTFDCSGIAYACNIADIYITTNSEYEVTANVYDITLNDNGGSGGSGHYYELYNYGNYSDSNCTTSCTTVKVPTRTGYTFGGYYATDGVTQYVNASGTILSTKTTFTADTILYAKWIVNSYPQVVYVRYQNSDGSWGNYDAVINQNYNYGSPVSWSRAADATYKAASITSYTVTSANTLYVDVYRNTHTVTLAKGTGIDTVTGNGTYYYGQSATINATLLTGYHWDNWSGSDTITTQNYTFTVDGDKSFTANGLINTSTLIVNPNGGTWNGDTKTKSYTEEYGTKLSIPIPTKKGYTFTGWTRTNSYGDMSSLTSAATYTFGLTNGVTDTITASWSAKSYSIYLDPNGGTYPDGKKVVKTINNPGLTYLGSNWNSVTWFANVTKEGHTFKGFYTATTGGTQIYNSSGAAVGDGTYWNSSKKWIYDGEPTFYAQWTVNQYPVTYIDVVDSVSGEELGRSTSNLNYGTTVKGSDKGSVTMDNYYYDGYYYTSCTTATVKETGATVYRIFKERTIKISGNIIWEDWNNKNLSRPDSVTLHLTSSENKVYDFNITGDNSQNTEFNTWPYEVEVPKYGTNGNVVTYTASQDIAVSKEEGIAYKDPIKQNDGYSFFNEASTNPDEVQPEINVTISIDWIDNDNYYSYRPNDITIKLLQNGTIIEEVTTAEISYIFDELYKYDENGDAYEYTVTSNEVDRYSLSLDNDRPYRKVIAYTFQSPTFSVTIPKTVVLDGQDGIGEYTVSVQGSIDDRDSVNVIPSESFIMSTDYLSDITAYVTQETTQFKNSNGLKEGTSSIGTIKVENPRAGSWNGSFNFNIYFEFGE